MPYYRGDYYRGDYYRGDLWGSIKKVASGVIGFATGGVGGAVQALAGPGRQPPAPPAAMMGGSQLPHFSGLNPFSFTQKGGPAVTKGYHLNKSNEYDPSQHGKIVVPKHSKLVRNRHMNVANPRALARAARRAHGFLHMASKHIRYFKPHHPKGRPYVGRKRRSR